MVKVLYHIAEALTLAGMFALAWFALVAFG